MALFLAPGSRGDVEPLLAVAVALLEREPGAEVHLAAHPAFAAQVRARGCCFHPLRPGVSFAEQLVDAEAAARAALGGRTPPHLLAANWFAAPQGFSLAQHFRVHCLFLWPGAPLTRTRSYGCPLLPPDSVAAPEARLRAWALLDASLWLQQQRPLNKWRVDRLGLEPLPTEALGGVASLRVPTLCAVSPSVLPRPPDWPQRCLLSGSWRLRPDPSWRPPAEVLSFLTAPGAPPLLYAGFGAAPQAALPLLTSCLLAASRRAGLRLLLCGGGGSEGGLPAPSERERGGDVMWTDAYLPHHWLLPHCCATVTHGGAGTVAACLHAGLPQLLLPLQYDPPWWAERMRALGVAPSGALALPSEADGGAALVEALVGAIRRACEPGVRARAAEVASELEKETDGAEFTAEFLRQYASTAVAAAA